MFEIFCTGVMLLGFGCSCCSLQMQNRAWMMRARLAGSALYMSYFYLKDAFAGLLGAMISFLGSLVQVVVPERYHKETLKIRFVIAIILAGVGIWVFAGTSGVLPMIAVIFVRFSEIQSCVQRIRFGILLNQCCWLIYAIDLMILPFIMTEVLLICSNLLATWKFYKPKFVKTAAA